ncbi:hypothetical protein TNCV_5058221 [Trichonephila clavipes]|nr:hypothetical protein TNCV_5058221 [Trichonephila clavipes]
MIKERSAHKTFLAKIVEQELGVDPTSGGLTVLRGISPSQVTNWKTRAKKEAWRKILDKAYPGLFAPMKN